MSWGTLIHASRNHEECTNFLTKHGGRRSHECFLIVKQNSCFLNAGNVRVKLLLEQQPLVKFKDELKECFSAVGVGNKE